MIVPDRHPYNLTGLIIAAIFVGGVVSFLFWNIEGILDTVQKVESVIMRQSEGYRRVEGIEKRLDNMEERLHELELGRK